MAEQEPSTPAPASMPVAGGGMALGAGVLMSEEIIGVIEDATSVDDAMRRLHESSPALFYLHFDQVRSPKKPVGALLSAAYFP